MEASKSKSPRRKSARLFIVGMLFSVVFSSLVGVFLFTVPKTQAGFPVSVLASIPDTISYIWTLTKFVAQNAGMVAYKKALSYFANKVAYDAAVYLGSGGKGQKPLFWTNPGKFMQQIGDGAAGEFLDNITTAYFGKSLCTFTPQVQIKLTIMARRTLEPDIDKTFKCPLHQIERNIDRISKMTTSDMIDFQKSFDYTSSEIGAFMSILSTVSDTKYEAKATAELERTASSFEGTKDTVTGDIKTSREWDEAVINKTLEMATKAETTTTGSIIADAIDIFSNTLISRLYKTIFEKGVAPSDYGSLTPGGMGRPGIAAAKSYNLELTKPSFRVRGPIDILNTLVSCPAEFKETNNCVIDDDFRAALDQKMTVKEALEAGLLKGDRTFGYDATGQEPEYFNGYPYRSLVILRKYRIIPSTWEAAALYIKNYVSPAKNFGLQELVDLYDVEPTPENGNNPFYHLIDPNWVLKVSDTFCKREGPGEQLVTDQYERTKDTNGDDVINEADEPQRIVSRNNYCADERTCIAEAEDGSCKFYGYCTEEKPIWKFQGTECEAYENSCQTFTDSDNKTVSYIQNTVNYDSCSGDNAGCQWYCQDYSTGLDSFVCSSEDYLASGDKIRFDGSVEGCEKKDQGCHEYIRLVPGTNLVANSGFESFGQIEGLPDSGKADDQGDPPDSNFADNFMASYPHWEWKKDGTITTYATSQMYEGSYSMLTTGSGALEYTIDTAAQTYGKSFTLSFFGRSSDGCNGLEMQIGADHNGDDIMENYVDPVQYPSFDIAAGEWKRLVVSATIPDRPETPFDNDTKIGLKIIKPACQLYLDAVQLELGDVTSYVNYAGSNQIYVKDQSENLVANGSFSIDNGTDFYPAYNNDPGIGAGYRSSREPGNSSADGWIGTTINIDAGYGDKYAGSGGFQDVSVSPGSRYDVYAWVKTGGAAAPITTECLDQSHAVLADCNLTANASDARTQVIADNGSWTWVDFGIEADNSGAAFVRINLSGGVVDNIGMSLSSESLVCRMDEVGCELYDPAEAGDKVPGVVTPADYCPAEFEGCKSYMQMSLANGTDLSLVERNGINQETGLPNFNLIAKSGQTCEAAYVGCEEYTNLDEVAAGGEGLEYYTYIRQCLKPGPECATYYRWEGDDVRGYQLVAESLKGSASGPPELTDGTCDCDPATEAGCTPYYAQNGNSYLCLNTKTITCSDDCHPLRNTLDGTVYNAIPAQSIRCPSNQAGCREYRGSTGYNIRRVIQDDFEDGDANGWEPAEVAISSESLKAGGLSVRVPSEMRYSVSSLIETGRTYLVEFWAKAVDADSTLTASFDPSGTSFAGEAVATKQGWNRYVLGPAQFLANVDPNEVFKISGTSAFFIDNIILWETKGNVYLKYNSFNECPDEWVGCSLYRDSKKNDYYLKSFTSLCRPEKVGCESVIDTQNSVSPFETDTLGQVTVADSVHPLVNDSKRYCQAEAKGCQALGRPSFDQDGRVNKYDTVYLRNVPDNYATSLCEASQQACEAYAIGGEGGSYANFKDPNEQTCEYRTGVNILGKLYDTWFKAGSDKLCPVEKYTCVGGANAGKACFGGGGECPDGSCEQYLGNPQPTKVCGPQQQEYCHGGYRNDQKCSSQADGQDPVLGCDDPNSDNDGFCTDHAEVCYGGNRAGQSCDSDADPNDPDFGCADSDGDNDGYCAERACQTDDDCSESITGVAGLSCSEYWVGECKDKASGCNEYRDPQDPQPSLVSSTNNRICAGGPTPGAYCDSDSACGDGGECVYQGCRASCRVEYDAQGNFYKLDGDCDPFAYSEPGDYLPGCQPYYYIKGSTDTASCYGVVNSDEGCILFNNTSGGQLTYDSDLTYGDIDENKGSPVQCPGVDNCKADSNTIIKVDRDRVCNQWLYCKTSFTSTNQDGQDERLCYDIGNCQEMGSNGECTKPVGEGQCDNDPKRACRLDADCENNGKCVRPPQYEHPDTPAPAEYLERLVTAPSHPTDLTYTPATVDAVRYLSGYSRVGLTWGCSADGASCWRDGICEGGENDGGLCRDQDDCPGVANGCQDDQCGTPNDGNICRVVHGYYPTAAMRQIGGGLDLPNHDFENGSISPWQARNMEQIPSNISVIDDPKNPGDNKVLMVNPSDRDAGAKTSMSSLVQNDSNYIISFRILSDSRETIKVQYCYNNDDNDNCQEFGRVIATDFWQYYTLSLKTDNVVSQTYLSFVKALPNGEGGGLEPPIKFYLDDILLQAVLEKKATDQPPELPDDERMVQRSCRLYPAANSLSCDYVDEQSRIYKGWKGYCLERDPQNSNICLQWWPVDIIEGESNIFGGGEVVGYYGDAPLYYCLQSSFYEYRRPYTVAFHNCNYAHNHKCADGYYKFLCEKAVRGGGHQDQCWHVCIPDGIPSSDVCDYYEHGDDHDEPLEYTSKKEPLAGFWAPFDGNLVGGRNSPWDYPYLKTEVLALRCDVVGRAVDSNGENTAWAQRINGGLSAVWDIGYTEKPTSDLDNYGSLVPPGEQSLTAEGTNDINDPGTWDSDFNSAWGDPFTEAYDLKSKMQPIYYLSGDLNPYASFWDSSYLELARAGAPYSCKHNTSGVTACDDVFPSTFKPIEQFSGSLDPAMPGYPPLPGQPPTGYEAEGGGLGLKRVERLFADVLGVWVWGDGRCTDVNEYSCTSSNPDYLLAGENCSEGDNSNCNIAAGVCAGKICVGGEKEGEPCGCPAGEVCEPKWVCEGTTTTCGLSICTGGGDDACVSERCEGGDEPGAACSISNNCPLGATCSSVGGDKKCVSNTNPDCDCPGIGTCTTVTVCQDDLTGPACTEDEECGWWCGGRTLGSRPCVTNDDCIGLPPPKDVCLPVDNMCGAVRQRCDGDTTVSCSIENNCPTTYTCNTNSKCTYGTFECDCEGTGGFCANGVCSGRPSQLCASNGTPQNYCQGLGTCLSDADICRKSANRCNCEPGVACSERERCSTSLELCEETGVCGAGGVCADAVCVGGLNDKLACEDDNDCEGGIDEHGNQVPDGFCAEAVCAWQGDEQTGGCGYYCGQACGSDAACFGVSGGVCEEYIGVCTVGDNIGEGCNVEDDCPCVIEECPSAPDKCGDKVCVGGLLSGQQCDELQGGYTNPDNYCNQIDDGLTYNPGDTKYFEDTTLFRTAYNNDFASMPQCRLVNNTGESSDTRPDQTSGFPYDYCWIQPSVFNIKINNRTGAIQIPNGGGTAILSFNSTVDSEQIPIKNIFIDWGDGTPLQTINVAIGPLSNPDGPYHYAHHEYVYPSCADGCYVRVWVQDNWEKGSGNCSGGDRDGQQCANNAECFGGSCQGACRGGDTPFATCRWSEAEPFPCGSSPAYCSSYFSGIVKVTS
ncbi:MAG: carbohydrate binding domain-containing protein [Patescibacteria group bacterium]|nr:carbohydrate binding domain-containing protein [Patescibacteria group bacterium]